MLRATARHCTRKKRPRSTAALCNSRAWSASESNATRYQAFAKMRAGSATLLALGMLVMQQADRSAAFVSRGCMSSGVPNGFAPPHRVVLIGDRLSWDSPDYKIYSALESLATVQETMFVQADETDVDLLALQLRGFDPDTVLVSVRTRALERLPQTVARIVRTQCPRRHHVVVLVLHLQAHAIPRTERAFAMSVEPRGDGTLVRDDYESRAEGDVTEMLPLFVDEAGVLDSDDVLAGGLALKWFGPSVPERWCSELNACETVPCVGDRALLDIVVWVGASGGSDAAHDADACGTQNSACGPQAGGDGATEPDPGARNTARMALPEEGHAAGGGRGEIFESDWTIKASEPSLPGVTIADAEETGRTISESDSTINTSGPSRKYAAGGGGNGEAAYIEQRYAERRVLLMQAGDARAARAHLRTLLGGHRQGREENEMMRHGQEEQEFTMRELLTSAKVLVVVGEEEDGGGGGGGALKGSLALPVQQVVESMALGGPAVVMSEAVAGGVLEMMNGPNVLCFLPRGDNDTYKYTLHMHRYECAHIRRGGLGRARGAAGRCPRGRRGEGEGDGRGRRGMAVHGEAAGM